MNVGKRSILKLSLAITTLTALIACSAGSDPASSSGTLLPDQLHGLPQIASDSGEAAVGMIARLHKASVAPINSHIGVYGIEGMQAVLYVSRFETDAKADSQMALMAERIGAGTEAFGHFKTFELDGRPVSQVFGNGQVHYFFVEGHDLKWLAAPPALARPMVAEIMGIALDAIPPLASDDQASTL
jgi:hypothetical protein